MSISLNNHEQRIKTLESQKSTMSGFRQYFTNTVTSIDVNSWIKQGYNVFIVFCDPNINYDGHINTAVLVPEVSTAFQSYHHYEYGRNVGYHHVQLINGVIKSWMSGATVSKPDIHTVIGLKIYYIFRYNIYKILKLISPILKF